MHPLLKRLMKKRGIEEITDLKLDEKVNFDRWQGILTGGEVTVERILEFCQAQVKLIETQWKNLDNDPKKNERLVLLYTVYKSLIELITSPALERDTLEKYLAQLLDN